MCAVVYIPLLSSRVGIAWPVVSTASSNSDTLLSRIPVGQNSEKLYLVIDTDLGKPMDLNAGTGCGRVIASDCWVLKFILGFHL